MLKNTNSIIKILHDAVLLGHLLALHTRCRLVHIHYHTNKTESPTDRPNVKTFNRL